MGGGHPHCAVFDHDELLYVCDRGNDRIEVFDKTGTLKRVIAVKLGTAYSSSPDGSPGRQAIGSALDVAFSPEAEQKYMYFADAGNEVLWAIAVAKREPPAGRSFRQVCANCKAAAWESRSPKISLASSTPRN